MVTTDSRHNLPVAENKLNQEFSAANPNEKWVTDMDLHMLEHRVHLRVDKGRLAVSGSSTGSVFPESSRLGGPQIRFDLRSMDKTMERGLVINALQMALLGRKPEKGLLHHSDRGSQVNQIRFTCQ